MNYQLHPATCPTSIRSVPLQPAPFNLTLMSHLTSTHHLIPLRPILPHSVSLHPAPSHFTPMSHSTPLRSTSPPFFLFALHRSFSPRSVTFYSASSHFTPLRPILPRSISIRPPRPTSPRFVPFYPAPSHFSRSVPLQPAPSHLAPQHSAPSVRRAASAARRGLAAPTAPAPPRRRHDKAPPLPPPLPSHMHPGGDGEAQWRGGRWAAPPSHNSRRLVCPTTTTSLAQPASHARNKPLTI